MSLPLTCIIIDFKAVTAEIYSLSPKNIFKQKLHGIMILQILPDPLQVVSLALTCEPTLLIASASKPWPNGVASKRKLRTCVHLQVCLARALHVLDYM